MAVDIQYVQTNRSVSCIRCGSTNIETYAAKARNTTTGEVTDIISCVCKSCGQSFVMHDRNYIPTTSTTKTNASTSTPTPQTSTPTQYTTNSTSNNVTYEVIDIHQPTSGAVQDDGGMSKAILDGAESISGGATVADVGSTLKSAYHSANIYSDLEIRDRLYSETFRFGLRDTYGAQGSGKEVLFFTKPDLHIFRINDTYDNAGAIPTNAITGTLSAGLANIPFWTELAASRRNTTLASLQLSRDVTDPFNHLLQNMVKSTMDVPGLSSDAIETPTNMYGVGYSYRGSSEGADDNPTFSLEFRDTKYLDVYTYFKAYEEYETIKHHGLVRPPLYYIVNKIIHDQFSIYKFILADDMETIIYYGKMYGVMPMSLPRDVFSNPTFDDGINYTIEFKAAFYEDMKPDILADFNALSQSIYNAQRYQINPYNAVLDKSDMRTAVAAAVVKDTTSAAAQRSPLGYVYKLKWRGGRQL